MSRSYSQYPSSADDLADLVHVDQTDIAQLLDVLDVFADDLNAQVAQRKRSATVLEAFHCPSFLDRRLFCYFLGLGFGEWIDAKVIAAGYAEMPAFRSRFGVRSLVSTPATTNSRQ
jgi:hypothetical protein